MGKERYPFLGGHEIGYRSANKFMAAIRMADQFCATELPDRALGSFYKGINQFHAPNLQGPVGQLRSMGK